MARRLVTILLMLVFVLQPYAQQRKTATRKTSTTKVTKRATQTKKKTTAKRTVAKKKTAAKPTTSIKGLQNQKAKLRKEMQLQQKKLKENERNVKARLQNLMAINTEIDGKKKTIDSINHDIDSLTADIRKLDRELAKLKRELADKKDKYVKSMRYMHRNSSFQSQLMFIFSAKNFTQMYRRMRFMREYAGYQRTQGEMVKQKQAEVTKTHNELVASKAQKKRLLERGEQEHKNLLAKQDEHEKVVSSLKKQQKTIQTIIAQQQKKDAELNAEIDRLIAIELERQRALAEAKRKAEEKARAAAESKSKSKGKTVASRKQTKAEDKYLTPEERRISGSFESNKGRLPVPVVGQYRIVSHFGQYNVIGLRNVKLDNKGINIMVKPGTQVRSIFDGEVSAIFSYGGSTGVMVRHGSYISVYCNLTGVAVRKGQKVSTRQVIGRVDNTNVLQFQLRKETAKLNPSAWLGR